MKLKASLERGNPASAVLECALSGAAALFIVGFVCLVAIASGCIDSDESSGGHGGVDVVDDAGADVVDDVLSDVVDDSEGDLPDACLDADLDVCPDTPLDIVADVATDTSSDTESDAPEVDSPDE